MRKRRRQLVEENDLLLMDLRKAEEDRQRLIEFCLSEIGKLPPGPWVVTRPIKASTAHLAPGDTVEFVDGES